MNHRGQVRFLPEHTDQVVFTTLVVTLVTWVLGLAGTAPFMFGAVFAQSFTTISGNPLKEQSEEKTQ